jgi:hypothetical protein
MGIRSSQATMLEECSLEGPGGIKLSDLYRLLEVKSGAQIDTRLQVSTIFEIKICIEADSILLTMIYCLC